MKKLFLLAMSVYGLCLFNAAAQNAATAKKSTVAMTVDGKLDEADWASATQYSIDAVLKGEAIAGGASDLSGYFQTLWTDAGVYVAITVTDDVKAAKSGKGAAWNQDLVEVYFDMNVGRLQDGKGPAGGKGHYQEASAAPVGTDTVIKAGKGITTAYHYTGTAASYVKEVFMPWAALADSNLVAFAGGTIGFDVTIVDNDIDAADVAKGYRNRKVWQNNDTTKLENYQNMNAAGRLSFDSYVVPFPTVLKTTGAIKIDGLLTDNDWTRTAPKNPITKIMDDAVIGGGAADLSGYFQTLWTDSGVFVAVAVTDDVKAAYSGKGPAWNQDKVEVYFDMNVGKLQDGKGPAGGKGHYQEGTVCPFGADTIVKAPNGTITSYHYTGTAANYNKESFFPWSAITDSNGFVLADNALPIGFDVTLVDNDKDIVDTAKGRNYRNRMVWTNILSKPENYTNMNSAGKLTFNGAPANYIPVASKQSGAVKIDGKLDDSDWGKVAKVNIGKVMDDAVIAGGAADCSGYFQTLWTDSGVFVAVSVTDDIKAAKSGKGPAWNQDLVEVYFDMNTGKLQDGKGPAGGKGHYQEATACPVGADTLVKAANGVITAYFYTGTAANYNKETFYPWAALTDSNGFVLTSNLAPVGFDIQVVDNDKDIADTAKGRNYRNRIVWTNNTSKTENYSNMNGAGKLTFSGAPSKYAPIANKQSGAVKVDGVLDDGDWSKATKVNISKIMDDAVIAGGKADCSGYFQTLWSDSGMFVAVTVTDDIKAAKSGKGPAWNQDLVEIYFDMNVGKLKDGKGPSAAGKGHIQEASACPVGADTLVNASGTLAAYHYSGTAANYFKEVFIPWKNLKDSAGALYTVLKPVGFDIQVVDNDADIADTAKGRNYRNRIVWSNNTSKTENYTNMDGAGTLIISGLPQIPSALKPVVLSKNISLFPNPATEYVVIRTNIEGNFIGSIYDISGKVVLNGTFNDNQRIDVARLNKGVYFIKVNYNNQAYTSKFIKQ